MKQIWKQKRLSKNGKLERDEAVISQKPGTPSEVLKIKTPFAVKAKGVLVFYVFSKVFWISPTFQGISLISKKWRHLPLFNNRLHSFIGQSRLETAGCIQNLGQQVDIASRIQENTRPAQDPVNGAINIGLVL
jgi:hypothetical protein